MHSLNISKHALYQTEMKCWNVDVVLDGITSVLIGQVRYGRGYECSSVTLEHSWTGDSSNVLIG